MALVVVLALEAGAYVGLWLVPSPETLETAPPQAETEPLGIAPYLAAEMLHPFLGYVWNPEMDHAELERVAHGLHVTPFGFIDDSDVLPRRGPHTAVVAVTGGSFACQLSVHAKEMLRQRIRALPGLAGKDVRIVTVALGGYKQPQQLFAVGYLLAAGASFDVVINLDGFNEVALAATDNVPAGVSVLYPRAWPFRVGGADPQRAALTGKIAYLREWRTRAVAFAQGRPQRYSAVARLAARLWRRRASAEIDGLQRQLVEGAGRAAGAAALGPPTPGGDGLDTAVDVWRRGSRLLAGLCAANGIRYFHFLQPNQYVDGSKPMSADERRLAIEPAHPYRPAVAAGYPKLIASGRELSTEGVAFADLTRALADHTETLYADSCCHLSPRGYEVVAAAMIAFMEGHWEQSRASRLSSR